MQPSEGDSPFRMFYERAEAEGVEAEKLLTALAETYSPEGLFAAAFVFLVVGPKDSRSDTIHGDIPARLERLVFHLWRCPQPGSQPPDVEAVERLLEAAKSLLAAAMVGRAVKPRATDDLTELIDRLWIDAQVIRGSAYPEQTSEEILEIAGPFDASFLELLGATPSDLAPI